MGKHTTLEGLGFRVTLEGPGAAGAPNKICAVVLGSHMANYGAPSFPQTSPVPLRGGALVRFLGHGSRASSPP